MNRRTFNQEQIKIILQNENVVRCGKKSISYREDFKILAIKKGQEGLPPKEIFKQAGFDLSLIGFETPQRCLYRWRRLMREKGARGLSRDGRGRSRSGGRPKNLDHLTEKEKIIYLEAEVAYLKEKNRFLVKLRKVS